MGDGHRWGSCFRLGVVGKKKTPRQKPVGKIGPEDVDLAEKAAAFALERGRWKEACEGYKALNKRFPQRYDAPLAQAYVGRFEEFLSRGMYEPAGQILGQLRGLVADDAVFPLEFRLTRARGLPDDGSATLWSRLRNDGDSAELRREVVDALVLIDEPPPVELREHPETVAVLAVREGLAAVCHGDAAALEDALRRIPRKSLARDWNLILRALDAWYAGDDVRVSATLKRLDKTPGAVARLAAALGCLQDPSAEARSEIGALALVVGGSEEHAATVLRIDELVREGQLKSAFTHGRKELPGFMAAHRGVGAAVGDYFLEAFRNPDQSQDEFEDFLGRGLMRQKFSPEMHRNLIRVAYGSYDLEEGWEVTTELHAVYAEVLAQDDAEPALVCRLHVETVRRMLEMLGPYVKSPRARVDVDTCLKMLGHARKLDPGCAEAGLLLVELHFRMENISELNRLLDELAESFPENPKILIHAGRQCVNRGTFKRGLAHLRKAVDLDPLNRSTKVALVEATLRLAFKEFSKKRPARGREALSGIEGMLVAPASPADFVLERRWMRLWLLALGEVYGDPAGQAEAAAAARVEWAENPLAMDVFFDFHRRATAPGRIRGSLFSTRFNELEAGLSTADLLLVIERARSAEHEPPPTPGWPESWVLESRRFVDKRLRRVVAERLTEALAVLWASFDGGSPDFFAPDEVFRHVRAWSRLDRKHPQLKLLHVAAELAAGSRASSEFHLGQLEKATREARARGDEVALRHAQRLRSRLERCRQARNPIPVPDFDEELDDDLENEDEPLFMIPAEISAEGGLSTFVKNVFTRWRDSSLKDRSVLEAEVRSELGPDLAQRVLTMLNERLADEASRSSGKKRKSARQDPSYGETSNTARVIQTELF